MQSISTIPDLLRDSAQQYQKQARSLLVIASFYLVAIGLHPVLGLVGISGSGWLGVADQALFYLGIFLSGWFSIALIRQVANGGQQLEKNIFSISLDQAGSFFLLTVFMLTLLFGGLTLLVIPGVVLLFLMSFARLFLVLEKRGILTSVYESRGLIRGYGWQVFIRQLVVILPPILVVLIPLVLGAFLVPAIVLVSILLQTIYAPFELIYSYKMYQQLKKLNPVAKDYQPSGWFKVGLILSAILGTLLLVAVFTSTVWA